jgi:hypothetical protein
MSQQNNARPLELVTFDFKPRSLRLLPKSTPHSMKPPMCPEPTSVRCVAVPVAGELDLSQPFPYAPPSNSNGLPSLSAARRTHMSFPKRDRDVDHSSPVVPPAAPSSSSRVLAFAAQNKSAIRAQKLDDIEARDPASAAMIERILDRLLGGL